MAAGRSGGRQSSGRQAPPPPFGSSQNEPVRVYPPESGRGGSSALQAVSKSVAVVGILSTSYASPASAYAVANRLIGRCVFQEDEMLAATTAKDARLPASIHLYYDDAGKCVYLLGVARPESLCFSQPAAVGTGAAGGGAKGRASMRKQTMNPDQTDAQMTAQSSITLSEQMRTEIAAFEHEKLKMQVLLYSSCNVLFVLREDTRMTTAVLKEVRSLAAEKTQLLNFGAAASAGKHSKRDSHSKRPSSSSGSSSTNAFAPGRCVPLVLYVVPAPDEILHATLKPSGTSSSSTSRSASVALGKALETQLSTLFRSLRGGTVGSVRMRDALSAANVGKERRVFNMDPAHSVVVVSRRSGTADGRPEARLEDLLDVLDASDTELSGEALLADETLLQPLEDDDTGFSRMRQYLHKFLDLLFSAPTSGSGKDSGGSRADLLTLAQWLKAFHSLVKNYQRLETKRKQDTTALQTAAGDTPDRHGHLSMELSR